MNRPKPNPKPSAAAELIDGLTELAESLEAGQVPADVFTCYRVTVQIRPHAYSPADVRAVRRLLSASQRVFAEFLGVSAKTVAQWEQGTSTPSRMACRFLDEIRLNPTHAVDRLKQSVVAKGASRGRPPRVETPGT